MTLILIVFLVVYGGGFLCLFMSISLIFFNQLIEPFEWDGPSVDHEEVSWVHVIGQVALALVMATIWPFVLTILLYRRWKGKG